MIKRVLKTKHFNPESNLLIFSDPRGGSTWLSEILKSIPNTFVYWEPLHVNHNKEIKSMRFGWRQHIPAEANWEEARRIFDRILSIELVNDWLFQKTKLREVQKGEVPIIKICRGNSLLPWLVRQYQFKYKPVYLLRHPFAVAASQLKQGGWDEIPEKFEIPQMRFNEEYIKHKRFLKSLNTKAEVLVANWCMSNIHEESNNWITVFYVDMFEYPIEVMHAIFDVWGIDISLNLHKRIYR